MHACADRIIDLFKCRQRGNTSLQDDVLSHNPAKLCYVIKQALREGAIGIFFLFRLYIDIKIMFQYFIFLLKQLPLNLQNMEFHQCCLVHEDFYNSTLSHSLCILFGLLKPSDNYRFWGTFGVKPC